MSVQAHPPALIVGSGGEVPSPHLAPGGRHLENNMAARKSGKKIMKAAAKRARTAKKTGKTGKRKPSAHAKAFGAAASACHRELKKEGYEGKERFKRVGACVKEKLADKD